MYAQEHVYRPVKAQHFRHLSMAFYDSSQNSLERLGFHHVGDVEDEAVKRQKPDPRTFLRIMATRDGTVNAAIYELSPGFVWRILMIFFGITRKIVELQTELENGAQIVTMPVRDEKLFPSSPKLFRNFRPAKCSVEELYRSHLEYLGRVMDEYATEPLRQSTLEEILAAENRQAALQREYLESVGWVTEEFLVAKSGGNKKIARALYEEIQEILAEEKATFGRPQTKSG